MSDSSAATSSTKSVTPQTNNLGGFVSSGGEELPEETKQPYLEPNPAKDSPKGYKGKMPQIVPLPSDPSPRSISMKKEPVGEPKGSRKSRSSRSRRSHHRRAKSEEYVFNQLPPPPGGYYPSRLPPQYHMMPSKHQSFGDYPNGAPPPRGHIRNHSMPQAPSIQSHNNMMIYPAPGLSPTANPMMPGVPQSHETGPLLPYGGTPTSGSYRKRKSQAASARAPRPPTMMPPAPPIYGSFEDYTDDLAVAPPPPPPPRSASPFSARDELMTLTGRTPPGSPSTRNAGMHTPPQHPRTSRRSPPDSGPTSSLRTPGGGYHAQEDARVSFSPHTPIVPDVYSSSGRSPYTLSAGGNDLNGIFHSEGSYRDFHRGRKHHRSHSSLRKMHMHQKSAQLFMEDAKGVRQPAAFRDVLFGVLFLMHIVGIVYLGIHYSHDAFMVNAKHGKWEINVWYRNVILIATLSGTFAVGVSTLTFILMTMIVRKLVQVSLILTIALSFAWGTIGIGVSPKNVVPITGIIALTLSVGYAFVVWDRIPFASANLMAGFHGVRQNASTVLVAFAFQFLALIWSIFFVFVVIGVYDAVLNGHLSLSQNATTFVYTMLFVSYFWTYSVFYVSRLLTRSICIHPSACGHYLTSQPSLTFSILFK